MNIYVTLFLLWCAHFLVDFMIAVFPVYKTMIQMDLAVAGMAAAGSALIGEGAQVFFGAWSDRGYRKALIAAGILMSCCVLAVVFVGASAWVFPLILVAYMGSGAFHPSAAGLIGGLSPARRGLFFTIFASGGALGLAVGQIGFYTAFEEWGQWVCLLAVPSLLLVIILLFYPVREGSSGSSHTVNVTAVLRLFGQRRFRYLYIALVCNTTLFFGFMFLLPDLLVARGYPDWVSYGGGHLAMVLGGACMMVPSGYIADRLSARLVMLVSMGVGLLLVYCFLMGPMLTDMAVIGLLFSVGAMLGVVHPVGLSLANGMLPHSPGVASAFAMGMVWCVSESCGPAASLLTPLFPPEDAPADAMLVLATINLLGLVAAWGLPRKISEPVVVEEVLY